MFSCTVQKDVPVDVNREMTAILQSSRFSVDFKIQMSDKQDHSLESTPQVSDFLCLLKTKSLIHGILLCTHKSNDQHYFSK